MVDFPLRSFDPTPFLVKQQRKRSSVLNESASSHETGSPRTPLIPHARRPRTRASTARNMEEDAEMSQARQENSAFSSHEAESESDSSQLYDLFRRRESFGFKLWRSLHGVCYATKPRCCGCVVTGRWRELVRVRRSFCSPHTRTRPCYKFSIHVILPKTFSLATAGLGSCVLATFC